MITLFEKKEECFGCGACAVSCPCQAITMEQDEDGFYYPKVMRQICIECGKCLKYCQAKKQEVHTYEEAKYFGFQISDADILKQSASGGAFSALAKVFFDTCSQHNVHSQEKVFIYGAALSEEGKIRHRAVESEEELKFLRNSKYVESSLDDCYIKIIEQMKAGHFVLFSGTPCQVHGLKTVLKSLPENVAWEEHVLLIDLVCNGVGSPAAWDCYRKDLIQTEGSQLKEYTFRDKRAPRGYAVSWRMEEGTERVQHLQQNRYWLMYQRGFISRPSCAVCSYAAFNRCSDVTIGDFHGLKETEHEFQIDSGVSLVIANSQKGLDVSKRLREQGMLKEYRKEDVLQPRLQRPTFRHPLRNLFLKDIKKLPFSLVLKKYGAMLGEKEK